ncbi:MAG: YceI family protein [Pseudomonadota bacterium]
MRHPVAAAAAILLVSQALAQPASAAPYALDRSHAHVTFTVDHLGFSTVHGQFREFEAEIEFVPDRVEDSKVRFVIQTDSVDTFWPERDKHLRSKDFFNSDQFPEILFESTAIVPNGADTAKVTGNLEMVGETREVTLDVKLNRMGPSPFDPSKTIAGFEVTGVIDRSQFGINFAAPAVGVMIPIRIDLEISPEE